MKRWLVTYGYQYNAESGWVIGRDKEKYFATETKAKRFADKIERQYRAKGWEPKITIKRVEGKRSWL